MNGDANLSSYSYINKSIQNQIQFNTIPDNPDFFNSINIFGWSQQIYKDVNLECV